MNTKHETGLAPFRAVRGRPTDSTARVVIPAFRAEATIRQAVGAILQSRTDFEYSIVVVDDGGNGDLPRLLADLPVEIVVTGGTGSAAAARNAGTRDFNGRFLVFCDADVIVEPDCLGRLLAPLFSNLAEASVGNYSTAAKSPDFAARYKLLYTATVYNRRRGYLRNQFWTAIGAVDAVIFRTVGAFDTAFKGANGEDAELGVRLTASGYRIIAVPDALGLHCHPISLWVLLRNDWAKGTGAIRHYYNSQGMLSDNRHASGRDAFAVMLAVLLAALLLTVPFLAVPMAIKGGAAVTLAGIYFGARADLVGVFARQSFWFLVRACALMWLLDLLRFGCLGFGSLTWHFRVLRLRMKRWNAALAERGAESNNKVEEA
jgi:glycosyltransferase involved in cell wall biosynthesis